MFLPFFLALRDEGVPVSLREYLAFLEGLQAGLVTHDPEGFYYLGRLSMVKDERHLDRYDRAFAKAFKGLEAISDAEVLEAVMRRRFTPKNEHEADAAAVLIAEEMIAAQVRLAA